VALAVLWGRRATPRFVLVGSALALGLPLVPHALAHWVLSLSDRILLAIWVSAAEVGRYNVAYQLAAGLGLVYVAVNHSVMAEYGRALAGEITSARLGHIVRQQVAFVLIVGIAGATLGFVALEALPPGFEDAQRLFPWLVLANVLFGLYLIPMNSIALLAGETRRIWRATGAAAVANIVLNLVLIPVAGTAAAAAATVVAYALLLVLMARYAHARAPVSSAQPVGRVLAALSIAVAVSAVALLTLPTAVTVAAIAATAWLVVGGAAVLLLLRSGDPLLQATFPERA
jgi:O-antigen/teichoic acid export membrane protein